MQSIAMNVPVCLPVCLYVICDLRFLYVQLLLWFRGAIYVTMPITTCPNFTKFSVHVTVAAAWSFDDHACTYGFVDDVMIAHNGLWHVASRAHSQSYSPDGITDSIPPLIDLWHVLKVTDQGAARGAKLIVYDCLVGFVMTLTACECQCDGHSCWGHCEHTAACHLSCQSSVASLV